MRLLPIIVFLLVICQPLSASIDSLRSVLRSAEGVEKVKTHLAIARHYLHHDIDSFKLHQRLALRGMTGQSCSVERMMYLSNEVSVMTEVQVKLDSAMILANRGLKCAKERNDDVRIAEFYENIGNVFYYKGNYSKAYESFYQSLEFFTKVRDRRKQAIILSSLAVIKDYLGDNQSSLKLAKEALPLIVAFNDTIQTITAYQNMGSFFMKASNLDSALHYQRIGIELAERIKSNGALATSYWYVADIWKERGELDSTIANVERSMELAESVGDKHLVAFGQSLKGEALILQGKHRLAIPILEDARGTAEQLDGANLRKAIYEGLYLAYEATNNYKDALAFYKALHEVQERTLGSEKVTEMKEVESEYEMRISQIIQQQEEERQRAEESRQTQMLGLGVVILTMLLVLLAGYFYRREISPKVIDFVLLVATLLLIRLVHLIYNPYSLTSLAEAPYIKIGMSVMIAIVMGQVHSWLQRLFKSYVKTSASPGVKRKISSGDL